MIEIDAINGMIYEAHTLGSCVRSMNTTPCSLCKHWIEENPDKDVYPRIELPEIHFHGSEFNACERKTYLNYINGGQMSFSNASFLLEGHMFESSILRNIEAGLPDGWKIKIFENEGERVKKLDVLGFSLVTHMDAVLMSDQGVVYGIECKAVKDKNHNKYASGHLDDIWFGQIQSYMFVNNIDSFYVIVKNRDSSKIHIPIKVDKDMDFIAKRLNKLKLVADTISVVKKGYTVRQPDRKHETSKNVECEFCPFKSVCWGN